MKDGSPDRGDEREEARLIQQSRRGDTTAIEQLFERYQKHVYNLAYRLCGNYDDANDIAQEAFLRVYHSLGNFRGEANFSTWLYRIVTNVFLDERKKQRVRSHSSLEEYLELEDSTVARQIEDPSPGPEEALAGKERSDLIGAAVLSLPETQRVMIALYHFQERSYEEIAEIMDMPIGTVKSRLNRARLALRVKLESVRELLGA
jgi:RNA polymerase sigma-70 factor (ECF subfamily)